jgi:hypothetical protein
MVQSKKKFKSPTTNMQDNFYLATGLTKPNEKVLEIQNKTVSGSMLYIPYFPLQNSDRHIENINLEYTRLYAAKY